MILGSKTSEFPLPSSPSTPDSLLAALSCWSTIWILPPLPALFTIKYCWPPDWKICWPPMLVTCNNTGQGHCSLAFLVIIQLQSWQWKFVSSSTGTGHNGQGASHHLDCGGADVRVGGGGCHPGLLLHRAWLRPTIITPALFITNWLMFILSHVIWSEIISYSINCPFKTFSIVR